jgi:hypothetical protein
MSRSGTGAPSSFLGVPHQGRRDGNSRRSGRRDGGGGGSKKLLGQSAIGRCPTNARGRPGDIPNTGLAEVMDEIEQLLPMSPTCLAAGLPGP